MKLNKNKNLVSYSKDLAEARYSLNLMEQKLVWAMTSLISPDDEEFKTYRVEIKHLVDYIGIDKKSALRELDKITDSLMERVLRIPVDDGNSLLKVHWVSHCKLNKKHMEFSFHGSMKPYLLKLKEHFTSHKYRILVSFRGSYTIRIYQLLKIYEYKGNYKCSLEDFRKILDIQDSYKAFKDFRKRVINPAKKEFETRNKETGCYQSDITFDLETSRTGRSISHLNFIIRKQAYQEQLAIELPDAKEILPAVLALKKYGIADSIASDFVDEQGETDILRCVSLYEEALKSGKVKNKSGGYLIKMLQRKAGRMTEAEKQAEAKKKERATAKKEAAKKERLNAKKQELEKQFRVQEKKKFLASLSEEKGAEILATLKKENFQIFKNVDSLDDPKCTSFLTRMIPNFEKNKKAYVQKNLPKQ